MNNIKNRFFTKSPKNNSLKKNSFIRPALCIRVEKETNSPTSSSQKYHMLSKFTSKYSKVNNKDLSLSKLSKDLELKRKGVKSFVDIEKNVHHPRIKLETPINNQSKEIIINAEKLKKYKRNEYLKNKQPNTTAHKKVSENFLNIQNYSRKGLVLNNIPSNNASSKSPLGKIRITSKDKTKINSGKEAGSNSVFKNKKVNCISTQRAELYIKLDKTTNTKARSIDRNSGDEYVKVDRNNRKKFMSEDREQNKYILNDKPVKYLKETEVSNEGPTHKEIKKNKPNEVFLKLKKAFDNSDETKTICSYIKSSFKDWSVSNQAEMSIFKTQIGFYKIKQKIGKGCFGKVYLAIQILTQLPVALKVISKSNIKSKDSRQKIEKEVSILKKVNNHHSVIKLYEVFEDTNFVYMVFEYLENGDLVQYFKKNPLLDEAELKIFFNKIVKGIEHLHKNNIIHRDIKLDNILLDKNFNPKICDFGISSIMESGKRIFDTGGTPAYLAPEVIKAEGGVGPKSDTWSLGILLYLLNFGIVPFKASDMQVLYNKIIVGNFKFPDQDYTSFELIDLIQSLIVVEVESRLSISEMLQHPWLKSGVNSDVELFESV